MSSRCPAEHTVCRLSVILIVLQMSMLKPCTDSVYRKDTSSWSWLCSTNLVMYPLKKTESEESRLQTQFSWRPEVLRSSNSSSHNPGRAHTWRHTLRSQIVPKMWISCHSVFFEENFQPDPELQICKTGFVRKSLPKYLWIYHKLACLTSQRSRCFVITRFHHEEEVRWYGEDFRIKSGGSLYNAKGLGERVERSLSISRMNSKFGSTVTHTSLYSKQYYNSSYREALDNIQMPKKS